MDATQNLIFADEASTLLSHLLCNAQCNGGSVAYSTMVRRLESLANENLSSAHRAALSASYAYGVKYL